MKTNYFKLLKSSLMVLFLCLGLSSWGQYVVDFDGENDDTHATQYGFEDHDLNGIIWSGVQVIIPTNPLSGDWYNGTRSLRLRGHDVSKFEMSQNKAGGIGDVTFEYRQYGTDTQVSWKVEYSTDNGSTWTQLGNNFTATQTVQTFSETLNEENARIRIVCNGTGTGNRRMNIDDLVLTDNVESTDPALSVSESEITGLNYIFGNGPSDAQSFTLSGTNLDGTEDVMIGLDDGASSDFEISLNATSGYDTDLFIEGYDGTDTEIFVRLKAGKAIGDSYGDIITIFGDNTNEVYVLLLGEVTAIPSVPVVSDAELTGSVGVAFSYQVVATNEPTSYAISSDALPAGLSLDTETGLISGTPTVAGEFIFGVTVENAVGVSAEATFIIDIAKGIQTVDLADITAYLGDADMTLPATTDQGFTVDYDSDNTAVATVSGNTITITGIGTTTIWAMSEGDTNWEDYIEMITLTVTEAPEEYAGVGTFEKITSLDDLTDGYYVITNETDAFAMNNTHTTFFGHTPVTPSSGELVNPDVSIVWKIETNGEGRTIYNEATGKYVGYTGTGNTASAEDAPANSNRWTFEYSVTESPDRWTVKNVATPERQLSYNPGAPRFAAYENDGQHELQLYKLGEISTDPILNTSETEITGLGYMEGNTPASQSFSLNGLNLDPANGNITVTAPANFQVSTDDVSFNNSLNIAYTDGALAATDIYVRLNESLMVGAYNGDITISGGGVTDVTVSVEGIVTEFSTICGEEDFTNATELPTGNSYGGGTFTGNNDIVWSYHGQSAGDYEIDGNGFLLRRASDSYLEATISGGIGTFSFDYRKAYTGGNERQLELLVDGVQVATSPEFGSGSGADATVYTFTHNVNVEGEVTVRIKLTGSADTNRHVTIDNITWTCYSEAPTITWNGSVSSAWDVAENWTPNEVPTNEDNVEIAEVTTNNYPIIEVDAKANNIKVDANASLEIAASHSLTITNEINVDDNASFVVKDGANLVQINDVGNIGSISVEKGFTFSEERNQYNFVISPVVGQNIKQLFAENEYKAQWYDESNNMFVFFEGGYNDIANIGGAGIGQAIQENQNGDAAQTATYYGEPHNGVITVSGLTNGNTRFHLAGNPYPSHLDIVKFYNDNQFNIEPRFLFWDNRGNEDIIQYGDGYHGDHYAQINLGHGTATAASGATGDLRVPTQNVAVGNAFMLRLLEESESYSFNNSQRTAGEGENFLGRNYSTDGIVSSEMDRYWLTLNTPGGISVMNAVVYYDGGNDAFGLDDNKIMGGSDDIYTLVDEHQLKIQGKSSFDIDDKIQLGYKAYAAGIHTISIYDKEGVFADGQKIFIRDFQTGIVHELTQSDFTFKTFAGEFNDRFEIFYKRSIKASENKATLSNVVIYQNENHIQIAAENQLLSDVEIYDLNGVSVYQATDINLENWKVPNHLFGKGILVVVVKTADGEVVNKKLINK